MTSRAATLSDVAELAGVSKSTAARVLAGPEHRVAAELAERVRVAAAQLGYTPNLMARSLRAGSRPLLGLMVGDMLDPYFAAISESVTIAADTLELAAMVANMQRDPLREIELLKRFLEHRVSGVMLSGGGYDQDSHRDALVEVLKGVERAGTHVVCLSERNIPFPTFAVDNRAVGQMVADHLIDNGHRDIAVVYAEARSEVTRLRRAATRSTLETAGCNVREVSAQFARTSGFEVAEQVLSGRSSSWPTAIVAGSDSLAVGMLDYAATAGIAVPDDVSIIGIGNTYYAEIARPPLTTVDVCSAERARAAVEYLAKRLDGTSARRVRTKLAPPVLIERSTVAKPRRTRNTTKRER